MAAPSDFIELDAFVPHCLKAMSEPHDELRCAFARALGVMLVECAFAQQRRADEAQVA